MKFLSQINVNTEYTLPIVDGALGQVLTTDGNGAVYWGSVSAGVTNLDALTDVILTSPSSGQLLRYGIPPGSGEAQPVWYNFTPTYLTPSSSIDALSDVTITTATTGQLLQWSGSQWVNATLSTVEYVSKVQHLVKCGVAVTKGQAVYVTSADGTNMIVGLASNASEPTSSKVIGLAASNGAINDQIFVVTEGLVAGLNTSTATAGDPVWLGTNGNLIFGNANKPVAPSHLVYLGVVTRVQQNNGEIFVNVQNGFELNELHDVLISSPQTGQLVRRDSDGLWKNWSPNFLTAEADTLATVTGRGATTSLAISANGVTSPNFTSTALMIVNADTSGSLQPDQGSPANKIVSFRWQGSEGGYIDTNNVITFSGFKTPTGTASQFLKANGTVDSNTYLTTTLAAATYATFGYVDDEIAAVNTYVQDYFVPKTRTLTINGTAYDLSANRSWTISTAETDTLATVTGRGNTTTNSITVGGLIVDTNTLVVDSTNDRVGIGRTSPLYKLDVAGAVRFDNELYVGGVWSSSYGPRDSNGHINFVDWSSNVIARINRVSGVTSVGNRKLSMGILDINSQGTPEIRINTKIPFALGAADFTVNIKGFQYGSSNMVSLSIGWHYYQSQFWNETAISNGAFAPTITLGVDESNMVVIHLSNVGYWPKLYVESVYSSAYADDYVANWSWTEAGVEGLSNTSTVPYKPLDTSITGNAAYATSAGNSATTSQTNFSSLTISNAAVATQSWVTSQGYATSFSETDTLASVTGRGNSTSTALYFAGGSGEIPALHIRSGGNNWSEGLAIHPSTNSGYALSFYRTRAAYTDQTNTWAIGNLGDSNALNHFGLLRKGLTGGTADRSGDAIFTINPTGTFKFGFNPYVGSNVIWHAGNDGSGSGLDADLLDGIDSGRFVYGQSGTRRGTNLISNWNQTDFPDVAFLSAEAGGTNAPTGDYIYGSQYSFHRDGAAYRTQLVTALYSDTSIYVRNSRDSDVWTSWKRLWHSGDFSSTNISNWNTAYGWGNHAGLYLPLSGGTMTGDLTLNYSTADVDDYYALTFAPGANDYIIKASSSRGVFGRSSYGWHVDSASAFGVYSNGWTKLFGVEGGTGNTQVFGSLTVSGTITENSSIRYKENIQPLEPALAKVEQLKPVTYTKIATQEEEIGLIAEEVAELFPEVVKYNEEGQPDGISYSRLSVILLKAVQELTERVNKLENK